MNNRSIVCVCAIYKYIIYIYTYISHIMTLTKPATPVPQQLPILAPIFSKVNSTYFYLFI